MKHLALILTCTTLLLCGAPARADISDVTLVAPSASYTGSCPTTVSFIVAFDGDPGTVFGHQLTVDGAVVTKRLYDYVPPTRSGSINLDAVFDAAHEGSHQVQARLMYSGKTIFSNTVTFIVTCSAPNASPTPGPSPSPSASPS